MSSMFKKKGGLAFKPKIPSARPRPAPAVPTPTPKPIDDPTPVDAGLNQGIQETIETPETTGNAIVSDTASQTPDGRSVEPSQQPQRPLSHAQAPVEDAPALQTPQPSLLASSNHAGKESEPSREEVAVDPSLTEGPATSAPVNLSANDPDPASQPRHSLAVPSIRSSTNSQEREISATTGSESQAQLGQISPPASAPTNDINAVSSAPSKATPTPRPRAKRQASAPTTAGDGSEGAKPKKRQRKAAQEEGDATQPRPRQRRNNSDNQVRRRRARSLTPEDAENQVVDLQKLKMADLTKDLHIGKKFSRHDELRERERKARLKTKVEKDGDQAESDGPGSSAGVKAKSSTPTGSSAPPTPAAPAAGPQFRIVDGQIIVDQSSLVMDRHARAAAAQAGEHMETIEENDFTRLITSSSFMNTSKLKGPNIWNDEETELFYRGLRMFGTDFEIISKMFPHKQRRHIKLKYNREERHNPRRIDAAVMGVKDVKMDIDEYKTVTGSEFEPVESIEAEQRKIAEDYEAERKRVADEQEEMMRKKREELFADEDEAGGKKKKGKRKGKQAVAYGLNGEPIATEG